MCLCNMTTIPISLIDKTLDNASKGLGRRQQGAVPSWIFKHGTNIVDRGLKVLFSGLFCYFSVFFSIDPPGRG